MSRRICAIVCGAVVLFVFVPVRVDAQTPPVNAASESDKPPSRVWTVLGGGQTTARGDCTFCEVEGIDARYTHTWNLFGDIGVRIDDRTDAGLEVTWVPGTARGGADYRVTFLVGVAQFRPWESKGFFVKGGLGMALVRNWVIDNETPITQKALAVLIGGGWAFRPDERLGFQLHATQHVAAVGDFETRDAGTLENVMGNFWSLGAAVVVR